MTRMHLQIAAFAAIQVLPIIAMAPFMPLIAAWSPPLYACAAGLQTLFLFTARCMIPLRLTATFAGLLTGLLAGPFTAVGWLIAVPLVVAGATFDLAFALTGRVRRLLRHVLIGVAVGTTVFLMSLPVMSAEHLVAAVLVPTLIARLVTSIAGSWLAARIVTMLAAAGVRTANPSTRSG